MSQKRSRREYEADLQRQQSPFVIYGTPLPPLDENTRDDGSYVPLWKQEVTDDRGRKRLHGAFTGGFSAGYFNSVGSKEGWTPSTFVSSRSNRAKDAKSAQQQKVEDFMDDEDLREQEESRQISTADGFAGFGTQDDQSFRHALDDIFKPLQDSMGEKLLNKMGWKKGQGIGPRTCRKIDPSDESSEVKDYPPEDTPMVEFSQKQGTEGLGSESKTDLGEGNGSSRGPKLRASEETSEGERHLELSFFSPTSTKPKKTFKSSGIGVGSLNDTGSDDEELYEIGPRMSYNRVLGGEKKSKSKKSSSNANPLLKSTPKFVSKKLPIALNTLRKCHDGKLPLTGFVLADPDELDSFGSMSLSDGKYKPPEVSEDWEPGRSDKTSDDMTKEPADAPTQSTAIYQQQTAQSRANILKEAPLPSKSIFDYLSPAARDRLAAASGKSDLPPALNEVPQVSTLQSTSASQPEEPRIAYPDLDSTTASTALIRLRKDKDKPYADDLPKQGRYKDFLRFSSETKSIAERIPPLRAPTHTTNDEHLSELDEFATTANLFRPATGFLASRFTSAASAAASTNEPGAMPKDVDINNTQEDDTDDLLRRPIEKLKDPAEEAARLGMFGIATRTTIGFYPTKLVCKRFGVDMPSGI